jgi:hypothetical protein
VQKHLEHKAICDGSKGSFKQYENTNDGKIKLHEDVILEWYQIEEVYSGSGNRPIYRVWGTPINGSFGQTVTDYCFYIHNMDKDTVKSHTFWKGQIGAIRVASKARFEENGAQIEVAVINAHPATMLPPKEQPEQHASC